MFVIILNKKDIHFERMAVILKLSIQQYTPTVKIMATYPGFDLYVQPIYNPYKDYNQYELTKIHAWSLPYDKVVLLDADCLCIKDPRYLLNSPELGFFPGENSKVNGARLVIEPSIKTYRDFMHHSGRIRNWSEGQGGNDFQGLVSYYFKDKVIVPGLKTSFKHFGGPIDGKYDKWINYLRR